ncbi:hypothetical protein AMTRI_Chr02g212810 [Amborella trichopoda]
MSFLWKKSKNKEKKEPGRNLGRFSRLLSDLTSKRDSMVVQTGFPTSVADLVVNSRFNLLPPNDKRKRPKNPSKKTPRRPPFHQSSFSSSLSDSSTPVPLSSVKSVQSIDNPSSLTSKEQKISTFPVNSLNSSVKIPRSELDPSTLSVTEPKPSSLSILQDGEPEPLGLARKGLNPFLTLEGSNFSGSLVKKTNMAPLTPRKPNDSLQITKLRLHGTCLTIEKPDPHSTTINESYPSSSLASRSDSPSTMSRAPDQKLDNGTNRCLFSQVVLSVILMLTLLIVTKKLAVGFTAMAFLSYILKFIVKTFGCPVNNLHYCGPAIPNSCIYEDQDHCMCEIEGDGCENGAIGSEKFRNLECDTGFGVSLETSGTVKVSSKRSRITAKFFKKLGIKRSCGETLDIINADAEISMSCEINSSASSSDRKEPEKIEELDQEDEYWGPIEFPSAHAGSKASLEHHMIFATVLVGLIGGRFVALIFTVSFYLLLRLARTLCKNWPNHWNLHISK